MSQSEKDKIRAVGPGRGKNSCHTQPQSLTPDFHVFFKRGTLSTQRDTFEGALKLEWCQKLNTEKEIKKVEDKNKQRVQLRANALHSDYSMFIQPFLVMVVGGVLVTLLKTEEKFEK